MLFKKRPEKYELSKAFDANSDLEVADPQEGEWWTFDIKRKDLKLLMKREDRRPLINYLTWLALLVASGVLAYQTIGTWWSIGAFLLYGTIYSSSDPRSHDLGHGATFKSRRLNAIFCNLCLFMTMKEPVDWRWRHTRHHTDTIHVGLDPEILVTRPADLLKVAADFFFLVQAKGEFKGIVLHSLGIVTNDARFYVPRSEWRKMFWSSRLYLACMLGVVGYCVAAQTIVPLLFIWGPRFYANGFYFFGFLTQHAGLAEDSYDHRQNTRTFRMNPFAEFLYANLNFHIEHHVYPSIPYYNLPVLHGTVKEQLPHTYRSLFEVMREVLPALWRQAHDPGYFVVRTVPGRAHREENALFPSGVAPAE
ncbi:fatty acid desaturase [Shinella zoogloeoides]|uniref:fatty acid desaturase n=1 Tax=Shinella zoogloeoides TaxID=352475 RepID=UPI0028AE808A|nr:fatty acid desaturase [Shinella zoogloeoides]